MKTEVILKRPFMGHHIRQKSKSEMMSATDLVKVGNIKRHELGQGPFNLQMYFKRKSTIEFIEELQKDNAHVIITDRKKGTWVHPLLFMDIALTMDARFKVQVYEWIKDNLLKYRNDSGDSYKRMTGALYENVPAREFHKTVPKVAQYIREQIGVKDWNEASEEQLKLRDRVHDNVSLLLDVTSSANWKEAVKLGVLKTIEQHGKSNSNE